MEPEARMRARSTRSRFGSGEGGAPGAEACGSNLTQVRGLTSGALKRARSLCHYYINSLSESRCARTESPVPAIGLTNSCRAIGATFSDQFHDIRLITKK